MPSIAQRQQRMSLSSGCRGELHPLCIDCLQTPSPWAGNASPTLLMFGFFIAHRLVLTIRSCSPLNSPPCCVDGWQLMCSTWASESTAVSVHLHALHESHLQPRGLPYFPKLVFSPKPCANGPHLVSFLRYRLLGLGLEFLVLGEGAPSNLYFNIYVQWFWCRAFVGHMLRNTAQLLFYFANL